jgi:hypothetical protein
MATVIDSLVINLGLNANPMLSSQQQALSVIKNFVNSLRTHAQDAETQGNVIGNALSGISRGLLGVAGLAAAAGAGFLALQKHFATADAQLNFTSKTLGVSNAELGKWRDSAKAAGASADTLVGGFQSLQQSISHFLATGQPFEGMKWIRALGLNLRDVNGEMKKAPDLAREALAAMNANPQRFPFTMKRQVLGEMIGGGAADELLKIDERAKRAGMSLEEYQRHVQNVAGRTDEAVKRHQALVDKWDEMALKAEGLGRKVEQALGPMFDWLSDKLDKAIKEFGEFFDKVNKEGWKKALFPFEDESGNPTPIRPGSILDNAIKGIKNFFGVDSAQGSTGATGGPRAFVGGASIQNPAGLPTGSSGALPPNAGAMKQAMMDQLRKEGVPEAHLNAAASILLGQAMSESGLNPRAVHDQGTGYGIYGARLDRRDAMLKWLAENKFAPDSAEGQARYMAHEPFTNRKRFGPTVNVLMNATPQNAAAGSRVVTGNFENPAVVNDRSGNTLRALSTGLPRNTFDQLQQSGTPSPGAGGNVDNSQNNPTSNTTTNSVQIHSMNITTPDAETFAKRLEPVLTQHNYAASAATGLA